MKTQSVIAMVAILALAGCTNSPRPEVDQQPVPGPSEEAVGPWQLRDQRDLGFYLAFQAASTRYVWEEPGYCRLLTFQVPANATRLELTLVTPGPDLANPRAGLLGYSAQSASRDQWIDYPDVNDPSQNFLDNPKLISFDSPESGRWTVLAFTQGPAYQAKGNLTVELQGTGKAPFSLEIAMIPTDGNPLSNSCTA